MTILEQVIRQSQRLSPRTRAIYLKAVESFVAYAGENPGGWHGAIVEQWRDGLRRGRKSQTVNLYLAGLRFATKRIAELQRNPSLDFARVAETLKPDAEEVRQPLSVDQARAILATCRGDSPADLRDRALLVLGFRTGLRRAGLAGIQLDNIDAKAIRGVVLKGGALLDIILDEEMRTALRPWISWLHRKGITTGTLFRRLSREGLGGGTTLMGTGISAGGVYAIIRRRAEQAGISHVHPHLLRHSFISWSVEQGSKAYEIRGVTGQKTDSIVNRYTKDLAAAEARVSASLPKLI
jgi:integrase